MLCRFVSTSARTTAGGWYRQRFCHALGVMLRSPWGRDASPHRVVKLKSGGATRSQGPDWHPLYAPNKQTYMTLPGALRRTPSSPAPLLAAAARCGGPLSPPLGSSPPHTGHSSSRWRRAGQHLQEVSRRASIVVPSGAAGGSAWWCLQEQQERCLPLTEEAEQMLQLSAGSAALQHVGAAGAWCTRAVRLSSNVNIATT